MAPNPAAQERDLGPEIARAAAALRNFLDEHQTAALNRPAEPDNSERSIAFSAYDAAEAALGRLEEAEAALGENKPPEEPGNRQRMVRQMGHIAGRLYRAREGLSAEENPNLRETLTHLDSGLAWMQDALDILLGRTPPGENPQPYRSPE